MWGTPPTSLLLCLHQRHLSRNSRGNSVKSGHLYSTTCRMSMSHLHTPVLRQAHWMKSPCIHTIQAIVDELQDRISEDITLDSQVHSRIIGAQGNGIKKFMNEFKVDVRFPRRGAADPNRVTVTGRTKLVDEAIDHLRKLEDKYMEDDELKSYLRPPRRSTAVLHEERGPSNGFVVRQAPRTTTNEKVPDMSCFQNFPSIGSAVATKTKH